MSNNQIQEINVYDALKAMRKLTAENFPFSIGFISCNNSQRSSDGFIKVERCVLSAGLPKKKSAFANDLVAYENVDTGEKKHFWFQLLMTFNGLKITHDRISRRKYGNQ